MSRIATSIVLLGLAAASGLAAADEAVDRKALLAALPAAKITLQQGLAASAASGTPISAKFEIEDGHLQLSVYTQKDHAYSEVIVDHVSGKIGKTESISGGEDLAAAKSQGQSMTKANLTLHDAVTKAEEAQHGFHAVSATPAMQKGHPVAKVLLQNGKTFKSVSEALD